MSPTLSGANTLSHLPLLSETKGLGTRWSINQLFHFNFFTFTCFIFVCFFPCICFVLIFFWLWLFFRAIVCTIYRSVCTIYGSVCTIYRNVFRTLIAKELYKRALNTPVICIFKIYKNVEELFNGFIRLLTKYSVEIVGN